MDDLLEALGRWDLTIDAFRNLRRRLDPPMTRRLDAILCTYLIDATLALDPNGLTGEDGAPPLLHAYAKALSEHGLSGPGALNAFEEVLRNR